MSLANVKKQFSEFLRENPDAKIEGIEDKNESQRFVIRDPWGEASIQIAVPQDKKLRRRLAAKLRKLVLPKQFAAIYHRDAEQLEVIWTAYKMKSEMAALINRNFSFNLDGRSYDCRFGDSTDTLIELAKYCSPVGLSETNFRNILSFTRFATEKNEDTKRRLFGSPTSFFIDGLKLGDEWTSVCNNLNFYMSYYDIISPRVLIFDDIPTEKYSPKVRFRTGEFPTIIDASSIDENLLIFWRESLLGNEILRFMLHFRIIEYASMSYSADVLRRRIIRAISRPDVRSKTTAIADDIIEFLNANESSIKDDFSRFLSTIRENVQPEALWSEIENDKVAFSSRIECDGGIVVEPLISKTDTLSTFSNGGVERFARMTRAIRNVLSHGKDFPRDGVFRPTRRNLEFLRPWVTLLALASGEVVLSRVSR